MRRRFFSFSISLVILISASGAARADMFDEVLFRKSGDTDDLFKYIDKKKRDRDEDDKVDQADDSSRNSVLKKKWISDFTDTDFSGEKFQDFKDDPKARIFGDPTGRVRDGRDTKRGADGFGADRPELDLLGEASTGAYSSGDDEDDWKRLYVKRQKEIDDRKWKDLSKLIPDAYLVDWVPSSYDRVDNGGFTQAPDNGSPVPYELNGWVEIERDFPWRGEP